MRVRISPCAKFSDGTTWKNGDWLKGSTNVLTKAHRETVLSHLPTLWLQKSRLNARKCIGDAIFSIYPCDYRLKHFLLQKVFRELC